MNKGQVIGWSIAAVIALGIAGFFGVRSYQRAQTVKPFKEQVDNYLKAAKGGPGGMAGKIGNKLITVDTEAKEIDYLYFDLPQDRRATKPDEVDSVVQLHWGKELKGYYGNDKNKPGHWQTCEVVVIDRQTGEVQAVSRFRGSDPPDKASGSASGSKPTDQVVDWLANKLPRK